jgi:tetratricopeptide (TPR) repeat protein
MMFYKYGLIILLWILVIVFQNSYAQSKSELVRNGINKYLQGNYTEAMRYFDMAITNSNFTETKSSVIVTPQGKSSPKELKAEIESGNDYYTGVSTKNYVETSNKELTNAGEKKSDQIMQNYNVELSGIYLYKGRINLHLKNYSLALQNFTKGMNLNPSYNKSNIGNAIITKLQNYTEVCKDLKNAMEEGDISAKTMYIDICE